MMPLKKSLDPMTAAEDVCFGFVFLLSAALVAQLGWLLPIMKGRTTAGVLALVAVLVGCGVRDYDKATYGRMERAIQGSTNMMEGLAFADASKLLLLEGVPWDEGYCNLQLGQERIYHFDGFSFQITLEVRPPGITPGSTQSFSYTERELRSNGVWWVASFWPRLEVDRLNDPRTRMSNYWDNVNASFRMRGAQMRTIEAKMGTNR